MPMMGEGTHTPPSRERIPNTLSPDSRLALLLSLNLVQKQPSRARAEMEWALTSRDHITQGLMERKSSSLGVQ
jgi:hypothetical protein